MTSLVVNQLVRNASFSHNSSNTFSMSSIGIRLRQYTENIQVLVFRIPNLKPKIAYFFVYVPLDDPDEKLKRGIPVKDY